MSYDWQKNCAVVDRCYYFEYTVKITGFTLGMLAAKDLFYISRNYYADRAKARLGKYAGIFLVANAFSYWFNMYPLTKEERRVQWVKYREVGKLVYGLTFLSLEEDRKKRAEGGQVKHGHGHGNEVAKHH